LFQTEGDRTNSWQKKPVVLESQLNFMEYKSERKSTKSTFEIAKKAQ